MMEGGDKSVETVKIVTIRDLAVSATDDLVSVEKPLEIRLGYGSPHARKTKALSVTMRTPGHDLQLVAGFLLREGIVRYVDDLTTLEVLTVSPVSQRSTGTETNTSGFPHRGETILAELAPDVEVRATTLERNFYMTSSCGICGNASLLALQSVCPPRVTASFSVNQSTLHALPDRLREAQTIFQKTGSLHGAGLFSPIGEMLGLYEDVGRHNAVDKLLGAELLADRVPLRNTVLMLSGRVSFELMQKALMAGISMVVAVGAPSSLAVQMAQFFDIGLVGFLDKKRMNIYHGSNRVIGALTP